ncbi:uncharacterized protein LOC6609185 [Drosophila sechellia]|uniref:GM20197 n=1 Tax=Drosophila sechellia TaxID=7238 RepID=B4HRM5_DROSE|nr:uncharacterized protein LOC6609185 [Drosophila sechellia]EDW47889.1 GM20197 [Drosophila sechellia]
MLRRISLPHLLISFDQIAVDMDDRARWYREIYEIFDVTLVPPRQFICHDLAPYHEPKPDSPDQMASIPRRLHRRSSSSFSSARRP